MLNHGSLFSGIGGFDYAADQMGWMNKFHCENNPFCQKILNYYFPKSISYADIKTTDFSVWRGAIDVLSGGFPCQPFSLAGKRKGDKDDRHLWPEMLRAIGEIQPGWVVAENVPGLINWSGGLVFERVCLDLEAEGYEVSPFIIPACAKGAVHRRDRVWIVAYKQQQRLQKSEQGKFVNTFYNAERNNSQSHPNSHGDGQRHFNGLKENTGSKEESEGNGLQRQRLRNEFRGNGSDAADTNQQRQPRQGKHRAPGNTAEDETGKINRAFNGDQFEESWLEAAARLCSVDDDAAGGLDIAAISKSRWRKESLMAYGNAIVPAVAYEIFTAIQSYETLHI